MIYKDNLREESLGQLVVGAFGDLEKLARQELDLFLVNAKEAAKEAMVQIITTKVSYNWLALCVTITTVLFALSLVEGLKTIGGLSLWGVYAISAVVFLGVGLAGYKLITTLMKPQEKNKKSDSVAPLASVHTLKEGNFNAN